MAKNIVNHFKKSDHPMLGEAIIEVEETLAPMPLSEKVRERILTLLNNRKAFISGGALIASSFIGNILNYIFNAYLGRILSFNEFSLIGLIGGFYAFASIFLGAYSTTVNYTSGYLIGKYGDAAGYNFWRYISKKALYPSLGITAIWLLIIPFLMIFFHTDNVYLFLFFSAILLVGFFSNINQGFLFSKMMFGSLAVLGFSDPFVKLTAMIVLISLGLSSWTFSAIPLAVISTFVIGLVLIKKQVKQEDTNAPVTEVNSYSKQFFIVSLLSGFSTVAYFTFDIFLAKHFLSSTLAGEYALVSLVGKMIFFIGSLTSPFIIPLISRYEGENKNSTHALYALLALTTLFVFAGFVLLGIFGQFTVPILYGEKALKIVPYLRIFTFGMACYTIANVIFNYYLARKIYIFTILSSFLIVLQVGLILLFHNTVAAIVNVMSLVLFINLIVMMGMHLQQKQVMKVEKYFDSVFLMNKSK